MGFLKQEDWSVLPFPSPRDLPDPGIAPMSLALASRFFTIWARREALSGCTLNLMKGSLKEKSRERFQTQRGSACEDRGRNGVTQPQAKGFLEPQKLEEARTNSFLESSARALLYNI